MLRNSGNQSEADKFASAWVKDHPKDVAFRLYLAQSALAKKDYAKAAAQFGAVAEARPNDGLVRNNYAWTLGQAKDPRALEYAEKANKLSPNNPVVMDTLGVLLVEKGETKRGVELLRMASELAPKSVAIRLNLAKALLKDGEKSAAKKELETLEKLGDSGQLIISALRRILPLAPRPPGTCPDGPPASGGSPSATGVVGGHLTPSFDRFPDSRRRRGNRESC